MLKCIALHHETLRGQRVKLREREGGETEHLGDIHVKGGIERKRMIVYVYLADLSAKQCLP